MVDVLAKDDGLIEALILLNQVLGDLHDYLIANSSETVSSLPGIGGGVLGEFVEAQEIGEGEITTMTGEEDQVMEEVSTTTDEGDKQMEELDGNGNRLWLWILFLIVLVVLLYLAFRKKPEDS